MIKAVLNREEKQGIALERLKIKLPHKVSYDNQLDNFILHHQALHL